jgi:hypothetical protein
MSTGRITEYTAQLYAVQDDPDEGPYSVGFGQGQAGEEGSMFFNSAYEFDEQDRAHGMDTYDLSVGDGSSTYGGIESLVLRGDTLHVRLTPQAASDLGLPQEFRIGLQELTEEQKASVPGAFRRLFEIAGREPAELSL